MIFLEEFCRANGLSNEQVHKLLTARDPVAYTIKEFCRAHKISEAFYYKLKRQGLGPDEIVAGARHIIPGEAAARWRARMTDNAKIA